MADLNSILSGHAILVTAITALSSAFVGAFAAILSGIIAESYKRHRDRQGIAYAIAGEIYGILDIAKRREHVKGFEYLRDLLCAGKQVIIPDITGNKALDLDPVIKAHIAQLGLLATKEHINLPEIIVSFYTYLSGIRIDLQRLAKGNDSNEQKIAIIEADLALWSETEQLGNNAYKLLHQVAKKKWWSC